MGFLEYVVLGHANICCKQQMDFEISLGGEIGCNEERSAEWRYFWLSTRDLNNSHEEMCWAPSGKVFNNK